MRNLFRKLAAFIGLSSVMASPAVAPYVLKPGPSVMAGGIPRWHRTKSRYKWRKPASKRPASFYKDRRKKRKLSRTMRRYNLKRVA